MFTNPLIRENSTTHPSRLRPASPCCKLPDMNTEAGNQVRILAHSPGSYPILIAEPAPGEPPRAFYFEAGYDPQKTKPVTETWLRDNAIGRHSFVELDPPRTMSVSGMAEYVRRELLRDA